MTRAFTLIELLVTLAIIGLLLSLLVPALAAALDSADATVCRSQLHQNHVATMSYLNDYAVFPLALSGEGYFPNCPTQPSDSARKYRYRVQSRYAQMRQKFPRRRIGWVAWAVSVEQLRDNSEHIEDFDWEDRPHHNILWVDGHIRSKPSEPADDVIHEAGRGSRA